MATATHHERFASGGLLGELIRGRDWAGTALGPRERWGEPLAGLLTLVLETPLPMLLVWGREHVILYNDALAGLLGDRHPGALGRCQGEVEEDVRELAAPAVASFRERGPCHLRGRRCALPRDGRPSPVSFDLAAAPVREPGGEVVGAVATIVETGEQEAARARLEAELAQARATMRAILDGMDEGYCAVGPDGRLAELNAAAERLLGARRLDLLGAGPAALFPGPGGAQVERACAEVLLGQPAQVLETRLPGRPGWLELRVVATPGGGAGIYLKDVTERRESAVRQRLLMREVDHRAKNMLAVVQAVVRLTRGESREAFVEAVSGRIEALARAHTLLADASWTGADLATVVRAELGPWLGPGIPPDGAPRVAFGGPPLRIGGDAVQPLAMVLHELATNAARHGALSVPEGRVEVGWELDASGTAVRLAWREAGGPRVEPPGRTGFGADLIMGAVLGQLGGTAELTFPADGLRCTVTIPAERLLAEAGARPGLQQQRQDGRGISLRGRRVLVVEDDALQALALARDLAGLGCEVVGPVGTLDDALRLASTEPGLAVAVLDLDLGGRPAWTVVDVLAERGVPVVIATGRPEAAQARGEPVLEKPYTRAQLERLLRAVLARDPPR